RGDTLRGAVHLHGDRRDRRLQRLRRAVHGGVRSRRLESAGSHQPGRRQRYLKKIPRQRLTGARSGTGTAEPRSEKALKIAGSSRARELEGLKSFISSKSALVAPPSGHTHIPEIARNAVPGLIPASRSPSTGS